MTDSPDIGALVRLSLAGDKDAFAELVQMHQRMVFGLAYQRTLNRADAEDAAQEAFLRAYRDLRKLREPALFSKWLYGIAVNTARERRRARKPTVPLENVSELVAEDNADEHDPQADRVLGMVGRLQEEYRVPITLHYVDGLKYAEIAKILDISEVTARSRVHRAREKLRKML